MEEDFNTTEISTAVSGKQIGKYTLYYELGSGGMASVYLAKAINPSGIEKWVAIKQIHRHLAKEKQFLNMFSDESRIATKLQHPNVVQVFDVGEFEGLPYIVMEYLNGENLTSLIQNLIRIKKRLGYPLAARIISNVCEGLHHAHELKDDRGNLLGVVHRDISPQNIFITYEGIIKLVDFGIAKAAGRISHTQTGDLKGKYSYMSPEQALGQQVDRRSDIFSLGIILYEITTHRRLFKSENDFETLRKVISAEIPLPGKVLNNYPQVLEKIVLKCLQPKPEDRYNTAREMQRELEQYLSSTGKILGSPELSELMQSLFKNHINHKQQLLLAREPKDARAIVSKIQTEISLSGFGNESIKSRSEFSLLERYKKSIIISLITIIILSLTFLSVFYFSDMFFRYAQINIETYPIKALIYFDGSKVGSSPLKLRKVLPGKHQLLLKKDGYVDEHYNLNIESGENGHLVYKLKKKLENEIQISKVLKVDNVDKIVPIDKINTTDNKTVVEKTIDSKLGNEIKVEQSVENTINNNQIKKNKISQNKSYYGSLSIRTIPWSKVYLDGNYIGNSPIVKTKALVGSHTLMIYPQGKSPPKIIQIKIKKDQESPVSINF